MIKFNLDLIHKILNYKFHIFIFFIQINLFLINFFIWKKKYNNIHLIISIINNIILGICNYYYHKLTPKQYITIYSITLIINTINISISFYKNYKYR